MAAALTEKRYKHVVDFLRSSRGGASSYPDWYTHNQRRGLGQQAKSFTDEVSDIPPSALASGFYPL